MAAVDSLSALQFQYGANNPTTPVSIPASESGLGHPAPEVHPPLPGMSSTLTSQDRVTAWRTNANGRPMPISSRTNGTTLRFNS